MRSLLFLLVFTLASIFAKSQIGFSNLGCSTYTVVKPSCSPGCDGSIIITLPPISCYSAQPGGPFVLPYNISISSGTCATPVGSGTYNPGTYTIANTCSCTTDYFINITDNNLNLPDFMNVPVTNPTIQRNVGSTGTITCAGACTGSVSHVYFNATAPYSFTWTPPGGSPTFTSSNGALVTTSLCAGIMTTNVVDFKGCVATFTNNIAGPPAFNWGGVTTSVNCNGVCSGAAAVTPTGGTSGYTVTWSTGPTSVITTGQTSSISALCAATTVTATVNDSKGCSYPAFTTTINGPTALTITPTQTNVSCSGGANGAASVAVSGGVAPYNYTWTPGPGTNSPGIGGLPVGTQTVTITNNNNLCSTTRTFNITGPPNFTVTTNVTNVTCNGLTNGSASVTVAGGNGPAYGFTWSPVPPVGQGTGTISGLGVGSYTATISDVLNFCTTLAVVQITAPAAYSITAATQSLACFNVCTGAASLTVSGNTAPYGFTWSPVPPSGQGTGTISNLCSGTYTASITDAIGCPTSVAVTITQPTSITPNITSSSVSCNGGCNGSINAAPSGGALPYTYTLITPAAATIVANPPFNGLCTGVHTLIIRAGACPQTFTVNLAQPNALVPSIVTTSLTCFNVCNGSLAGNIIGGTPGYTLVWTTPTGTLTGGVITGQCAGNYTLTVTDANGCTAASTATLLQPTQITSTITPTSPLCNGNCNGILSAVAGGGVPGYTLSWSNSFVGNPNTNLCAGIYSLTVTDANNCTRTFSINLIAPPAITASITSTSPVCSGACNGAATVVAAGGTPSYTYQVNTTPTPTSNTTGIFTSLCPGNYIATITDINGCTQPVPFSITNPPLLTVSIPSVVTSCNACTGGATLVAAGGTPTYSPVWTNSLSVVVGTTSGVAGLCVGNYTATVTDMAGCVATATVNIAQTVTVSVLLAGSGITCFNNCNGSVVATASGGTPAYGFTWTPVVSFTNAASTSTASGMCSGTYTVSTIDQLGCFNSATITLVNPADITIASTQTNITCNGLCNGAISTTASGGTGTLSYNWSSGPTTPAISSLCAVPGLFTLTVTDQNNCPKTQSYTITQNPAITSSFAVTNPNACGANNGSICATVSGGASPYSYSWTPGALTTSCISGLGAGVYSVIVTDAALCTVTLGTSLTNPTGPTLTVNSQSVNCAGGNTGGATVTASGVGPAYTFTWTPAVSFTNSAATSTVSGLLSGTYNIAATGSNNCVTNQSVVITQAPTLTVTSNITNPLCNGSSNGSITVNISGGTPTYNIVWAPTGTLVGQGTQTVTNLSQNIYTVSITDINTCVQTRTFNVVAPSAMTLTATGTNVLCNGANNGSAVANVSGGSPGYSFLWSPGGAITPTVNSLSPNTYTVVATDNNSCTATATVSITEPTPLTSTLTSLNSSCSNSCNATATHVASGGSPGYSFSWTGSTATTSIVNNLCAGSYSATITDLNGCVIVKTFTVTPPAPLSVTLVPTNPLCNAACNGSISSTLSGAQGTVNYVWSPAGTGPNPTGLCPNNYSLIATDAAGCQTVAAVTLTNPPALLAQVSTTNPACNGTCNGIAISNPTNNVGTVSFTWTTPSTTISGTNTINGQCAGNYALNITDQNGCADAVTFTLQNPPALVVNPALAPATCSLSNGSVTVGVVGGTPSYTFVWSPPVSNTNVATGLAAGLYTVNVIDANNCANSVGIALSNANGPSLTPVSIGSVACNGALTGSASITNSLISGGQPQYTVTWVSPPAPSTVNPATGLGAGTYTAQTIDANSCILFTTAVISEPPPVIITPSFTLPTCNGICNGSISLNASGGTPGYTYSWTTVTNTNSSLGSACAGNYTIIVTDNNSCPSTQTLNLPAVQNISAVPAATPNLCFSNCAGSASVTNVQFATNPVVYSWSNGQTTPLATGLCNGIYTVVLTDASSCTMSFTTNITSPPQITATTNITSPGCNLCNGSSSVTAGGGIAPFTFSWTSGATGTVAPNLCAGLYQVLVTDGNSCTVTQNVLVSSANGITGETFTVQNESCAGLCNGSVAVSPIGGTPAYTYSWIAPSSTASSLSNLCAGNYFVQITDSNLCVRTASVNILAATALTVSPFVVQPSCGFNNGSFSLAVAGGTPAYQYNWAPISNTNAAVSGLAGGIYTVVVTDGLGCSTTTVLSLSNSDAPVITFTQSNLACFGVGTGSIIALGTSTASPVTYSWSNGTTSPTVTGLMAGVYNLTVSAGGCSAFQTFTLSQSPQLLMSLPNVIQPRCFGDCNGEISLIPSGGTIPYTFSWSPGSLTVNPAQNLCAGPGASTTYTGVIRDLLGCTLTQTVTLINPAQLNSPITFTPSSCSTVSDAAAAVTPTGGTAPYTFSWTGSSLTSTLQNQNGILSGTYTVVVTDSRSCTATSTVDIQSTIVVIANAGPNDTLCAANNFTLDGSGSTGTVTFNWYLDPVLTTTLATTPVATFSQASAGTYTYLLETISTSVAACRDIDTVVVIINPLPQIDAGPSYTIPLYTQVLIGGNPTAPTGTLVTWSPAFSLDNPNLQNPTASNTVNTIYTVTAVDANGCVATGTVLVELFPEIIIPNGFSPNGDSKNDKWMIDNINQFPDCTVEVYNRWGEQLFFSTGYTVLFDGRYKNKDLPVGTYYYVINLNHPAYTKPYTGPLTIFR
jgi:gliding motility-associated-like protein